jgi:hypothetical protein
MAKQKEENKTKYLELDIPQDIMTDVAEAIEETEVDATIIGTGNDEDCIRIGFEYEPEQRTVIVQILELVEEYNSDSGEEEEEED